MMKKVFLFLFSLCMIATVFAQISTQNFGTVTGSHSSATGVNTFIPNPVVNPAAGTTWARGGATAPNGPINLVTASNPLATTGAYVRAVASTSTSVSKFSPAVGYTGSTEFYTSYKVLFGDAVAGNTAASGSWNFYQGAGAMYNDANNFTNVQTFISLQFTYAAAGVINLAYRAASTITTVGLTTTTLNQSTVYTIEIVGNNKTSGTINYTYNSNAQTVAVQKFDLYVNGTLIGNDLDQNAFPANTNIASTTFMGVSSTSNVANIFVDDVVIYNAVPAAIGTTPTINVSPATLTGFSSLSGVPSAEQTYNVDGVNLSANIVITPPTGFQISTGTGGGFVPTNPINLTPAAGTVASTPIYVRMNSAVLGLNSGNITHTSTGAATKNVALSGNVLAAEPTVQSTITIGAVTNSTVVVNFSGGNGVRRILLAKLATAVNSNPVDGTTYTANGNFGSGTQIGTGNYVVYDGVGNTQLVTGLTAGATYHFAIYEYNNGGVAGAENYLVPGGVGNATLLTFSVPYVWIGLNGDWQVPANWAPIRLFPATNDSLLFTSASVNDIIINVPTQTVGYIGASLSTTTTLQAAASGNTLTIGNLTGTDFFVQAGSAFNINTANALTLNLVTGATASISGNMTFTAGAHKLMAADASGITFNSGAVFTAGTGFSSNPFGVNFVATANSVVFASGSTMIQEAGANPFALIAPLSAVVFNTGSLYKVTGGPPFAPSYSGRTYANVEIDNPLYNVSSTGGGVLSMDNLTITKGIQNLNLTGGINIKGNISVAAGQTLTFTPASAATVSFNGTTAQSISNAGTLTFGANQDVVMNNAAGLTLNTPVTLSRVLTFTSGLINTTATNLLTLGSTVLITGVSNASFVNGPVSKIGNTAFTFPVGKTNCGPSGTVKGYVALSISAPALVTDQFTAEYIHSSARALGPISNVGINHVSFCDYWKLDKVSAAPATVDITLNWDDPLNNCTTRSPYINNLPTLIIAHFNGATWDNFGGVGMFTGTTTTGTITWTGVSTFSPFSIASSSFLNPLPITINYFTGTKNNGNHLLNWKVTCVSVPSATIEMERSTDGRNYSSIYSIFATALRCQQPFNYTDNQPAKGINYYRLKMTDADGKVTYSTVVTLINAVKGIEVMNIAPNPVVNRAFNLKVSAAANTQMEIVITDMQGRILQKQVVNIIAGFNSIPMNVKNLASGTYQLMGNTEDGKTKVLRFVIQ